MNLGNDSGLTITRLAPLIRRRKLSPVELTRFLLDRIERLESGLNSYITITADQAMAQAKEAEKEIARGAYRGALHGIPICLKDLFYTRNVRTTAGSKILRNFVPAENAAAVDRLFDAGAVSLGKTNLHEFAFGATSINPHYGPVHNPWAPDHISGGSSGGSAAAVTAGLAVASMGTDTGGSIRIPATACGCVGLKPTYGRVPVHGVIPLSPSLDHVGPICRCVRDAALMLEIIAGEDTRDASSFGPRGARFTRSLGKGLGGLRIGVPRQYFFDRLQHQVRRNVVKAIEILEQNGAEVEEVNLKSMGETARLAGEITVAEALVYHWRWLRKRPQDYGCDLRVRLKEGMAESALTYLLAMQMRQVYAQGFADVLSRVDLLAAPALPVAAPRIEDEEVEIGRGKENVRVALLSLTRPGNLTHLPAITVPCGFTSGGLPTGLQLIGRKMDEETVLRAAYAYEQLTPWHEMFPPDPVKEHRHRPAIQTLKDNEGSKNR
jgi:aspartyl-tRNA(Asn)/glutamyl-tRNA(Gln) amidotransferase subunit A